MSQYLIFGIGLFAQLLFSARLLVQWIASEKAHKVLSPVLFWQLSMAASCIFCLYGGLRNDFAIILGQFFSYYIYIWNLKTYGSWNKLPKVVRALLFSFPIVAIGYLLSHWSETSSRLFERENIPIWLIVFGVAGQFTFTLRFIYQWLYSRKVRKSSLPSGFWMISLAGSAMIILYAVIRKDPVLILGQTSGFFVYIRNLIIGRKESRRSAFEKG
jgi:lipid-A-disaccharide synthase-like uncharacterized protein